MNPASLLSNLTTYLKYSRYIPALGRKENWSEIVMRNKQMHLTKYNSLLKTTPMLRKQIDTAYQMVNDYKILPSMRSMQFAGPGILNKEQRIYNCCFLPINTLESFRELMYLLLIGSGVGYSVQYQHISSLPPIYKPHSQRDYYIQDSIEGWADAVDEMFNAFTSPTGVEPLFKGDLVRPKGSLIKSIMKMAPGPENLLKSLNHVKQILKNKTNGQKLTPIEVMDIINILSECVVSGGVRRSAMICLFSPEDEAILNAKSGNWWQNAPWRARSNNSAVIVRKSFNEKRDFDRVWTVLQNSGSGEPGIYFSNDPDGVWGTNPCVETGLRAYQFCNLTEINASNIKDQSDFNDRSYYASLLGTLQAGYTDFTYLRSDWSKVTKQDALLGVGLTGIANGALETLNLREGAQSAIMANVEISKMLGINSAARVTCVKPSGTTSLVLGCSSGIHAAHSPYYIRHIRLGKEEPLYKFLMDRLPDLVEDEVGKEVSSSVLKLPMYISNPDAKFRNENVFEFLDRVKQYNLEWVNSGHHNGVNKHNVSATVSIKDDEWTDVKNWLWSKRDTYTGMACLPYHGGNYVQAPFEECDSSTYERLMKSFKSLNLDELKEEKDNKIKAEYADDVEPACAGGVCEIVR